MTNINAVTKLVGVADVVRLTGWDTRTVTRKAASGELNVVDKLSGARGAYIFDLADIAAIAEQRIKDLESSAEKIRAALFELRYGTTGGDA